MQIEDLIIDLFHSLDVDRLVISMLQLGLCRRRHHFNYLLLDLLVHVFDDEHAILVDGCC